VTPPSLFPKVPLEIVPDPRWPWNPIFLGEAVPGPTRVEETEAPNEEGGHTQITADFRTMGLRKERLGLRRWWRYRKLDRQRRRS